MTTLTKKLFGFAAAATAAAAMLGFAGPKDKTVKIDAEAPNFTLTDLKGTSHDLTDFRGKTVVLEWFNPECPFVVKHYRDDTQTMNVLATEFAADDVVWIRINSGAEGKQGAGLDKNRDYQTKWNITGPILLDESGDVGRMYDATNTPQMFVIDTEGVVRYMGAIDDDRGTRKAGETNYVRAALQQVLAGETVSTKTTKPYGCSVKY
ncbi:MAG: redoxin domain-containing protein [Planctomycetota bacterium]